MSGTTLPPVADIRRVRIGTDLLRGNLLQLIVALLLALASTAATLAVPLIVKDVIKALAQRGGLVRPVTMMAALALGGAVAATVSGYILARLGEQLILRLRNQVMAHTLRLPLDTVRRQGPGNLVARITSDAMLLRAVIDVGVVQLPIAAITVVFTLAVMTWLDWVLVLVTVGSFALAGTVIGLVVVQVKRSVISQQNALGELAQRFTASLAALPTIKAYRAEGWSAALLGSEAKQLTDATLVGARLQSLISPVMGLGQQLALVSVIIGGGARIAHGALTMPDFAAFLLYLLQLVAPVTVVATSISRLQAGLAARGRFDELLALEQESDGGQGRETEPVVGAASVEFAAVHFSYDGLPVLDGLTFTAPARGLTAMVGHSGAGKSTALSLIDRFGQAGEGTVSVLGHPVQDWPLDELRSRVAYVDQTFTLLEGTIRDNLELGHSEAKSDEELLTALAEVGLREDITQLPDGLDTVIGRAADLSGGQRQRLALARALLSDADLVLLDEPTSQLDSINERRLRGVVDRLAQDHAVIVVAHRLSTIQHADHVLVLSEGRLLDAGTHQELMTRCAHYADLVRNQQWLDTAEEDSLVSA